MGKKTYKKLMPKKHVKLNYARENAIIKEMCVNINSFRGGAMKQFSYLCNDKFDFAAKLAEFQRVLHTVPEYSCILATVFVDSYMKNDVPVLVEALKENFPDVQIVGGIVSANISAGVINLCGISLTFKVFATSTVEIIPLNWQGADSAKSAAMGKLLLGEIRQMYQPVAIHLISSGYNLDTDPFLTELSNLPEDIAVCGGVVDDGTVSREGFVFTDSLRISRGMIAVVYKGRNLFVNLCSCSGWRPLGRSMTITGLADDNTTITELDGKFTVQQVYERYLGISWDESFWDEAVIFPICTMRDGAVLNRMPRMFGKAKGSANYGAYFRLGDTVQLCYGNPTVVIQGTYRTQYDMMRFQPEGIFAVSCWSRKVLLNRDVNSELEVCRSGVPSTGIYALGEYIREPDGKIYLNNMYLSIMGMREGGIEHLCNDASCLNQRVQFQDWGNSVISHMMHFMQTISGELEEYAVQLKRMADTDKLTGLYNRNAIDRILPKEIKKAKVKSTKLALLLLDLDNFKHINDNLGHLVGDAALMQVAKVLQKNMTPKTFAGRWGGDEFIVVLPHFSPKAAIVLAEAIRREIEEFTMENEHFKMTVSMGVALARPLDTTVTLFKRADEALYRAKYQHKKNNVQFAE